MSDFVVDASIALSWLMADESDTYADQVLQSLLGRTAIAPSLLILEVANGLLMAEKRNRTTTADTTAALNLFQQLPITLRGLDSQNNVSEALSVARSAGLSVYDASYVALAAAEGLPLATLDLKLSQIASSLGVSKYVP